MILQVIVNIGDVNIEYDLALEFFEIFVNVGFVFFQECNDFQVICSLMIICVICVFEYGYG